MVFAHSSGILNPLTHNQYIGGFVSTLLAHAELPGVLGVELFFVLSGFLIGTILIGKFMTEERFSFAVLKNFWLRRWFRTLPNYWLILTADILLFKALGLQKIETYKLLFYPFLQNLWYPNPRWFFGEAWSLSIEEWFYISLPLVLLLCSRLFAVRNKAAFLVKVFTAYLLLFAAIRLIYAWGAPAEINLDEDIRKIVLFRLDAVMYGVLMAAFWYFRKETAIKLSRVLFVVSVLAYPLFYWLMSDPGINITNSPVASVRFACNAFLYTLIPLLFSLCLPYTNNVPNRKDTFITKAVRHVSKISYSMYLVHYSLIYIPFFSFLQIESGVQSALLYVLYWLIVLALSSLLYRFYEQPIMRYRDKITTR